MGACACLEREKKIEGRKRQFLLAGGIFPLIETVEALVDASTVVSQF